MTRSPGEIRADIEFYNRILRQRTNDLLDKLGPDAGPLLRTMLVQDECWPIMRKLDLLEVELADAEQRVPA
jgi:hypothetical protein